MPSVPWLLLTGPPAHRHAQGVSRSLAHEGTLHRPYHLPCKLGHSSLPCCCRLQVDWEAILSQQPGTFVSEISRWLVPAAGTAPTAAAGGGEGAQRLPELSSLPSAASVLSTMRVRIQALNKGLPGMATS